MKPIVPSSAWLKWINQCTLCSLAQNHKKMDVEQWKNWYWIWNIWNQGKVQYIDDFWEINLWYNYIEPLAPKFLKENGLHFLNKNQLRKNQFNFPSPWVQAPYFVIKNQQILALKEGKRNLWLQLGVRSNHHKRTYTKNNQTPSTNFNLTRSHS